LGIETPRGAAANATVTALPGNLREAVETRLYRACQQLRKTLAKYLV